MIDSKGQIHPPTIRRVDCDIVSNGNVLIHYSNIGNESGACEFTHMLKTANTMWTRSTLIPAHRTFRSTYGNECAVQQTYTYWKCITSIPCVFNFHRRSSDLQDGRAKLHAAGGSA